MKHSVKFRRMPDLRYGFHFGATFMLHIPTLFPGHECGAPMSRISYITLTFIWVECQIMFATHLPKGIDVIRGRGADRPPRSDIGASASDVGG